MSGILVYSRKEAERNAFSIEKYIKYLDVKLVFQEELNFSCQADFVINRTNNYKIAQSFEKKGVRVFNPSSLTKLSNDKQVCYEFMQKNGIEIMPINYGDIPAVKKAAHGKGGTAVFMINKKELFEKGYVYQKPASDLGKDLRVWLINGEIKAAILRESKSDFRANFCLGGIAKPYILSQNEKNLIHNISDLIKYDYIGIDFVFNSGKIVFNEIEDSVGARMIYSLTDIDIIKEYCNYISCEVKNG